MSGSAKNQTEILNVLGALGVCDVTQLTREVSISRHELIKTVGKMIVNKHVLRLELGCYKLTDHGVRAFQSGTGVNRGPQGPATGKRAVNKKASLRQRAWNVMRMGDAFDIEQLSMVAATEVVKAPQNNLQRYIRILVRAEYCITLPTFRRGTRPGSNGHRRYRLVKNTGEIAPVYKSRAKPPCLFDFNTREEIPCT